ncbi:MAG: cytochrome c biogenesis protein CcsA, partial [Bacteroidota bacterium]|nr:cytochrome c biogenesis protein CcsA [Bacteroidota bacterium]
MTIEYLHENLLPGRIGYFFVILSFCASLFGLLSYYFYFKTKEELTWRGLARVSFLVHGISVVGIFSVLFFLIYTHQFQYHYVWAHSSTTLPVYYIIASFWEGQEGSFLLWTFWHAVLGLVVIYSAKTWEAPVMIVLCLAQAMLSSMILGISEISLFGQSAHLGKIGSNPFILLREVFPELPLFRHADYVSKIEDGRGLNALLQNYWMVIHPPVLFLGFASTIIPFAYAIAGLWTKRFGEWVRPALPWVIFSGMALSTGILMGGAWAYEALSFGGFWAWDPVENASLVPWIIMIAGLHCMVIFRSRQSALGASYIFMLLSFLLILYSTFLTRSGVLSDTSVHSFTDLGLSGQLLIFLFLFLIIGAASLIKNWKNLPHTQKEESTYSREFWMFIGSLLLSLSALHIIAITSIPVVNKVLGTTYAAPTDPITTYHQLQIPFAIIITILTGLGQYFRYRKTEMRIFYKHVSAASFIALVLTVVVAYMTRLENYKYIFLLFTCMFATIANADIIMNLLRQRNFRLSGAAVAHIGFALLLAGALISNGKKRAISINTEEFDALSNASAREKRENKVLFKNRPVVMHEYLVTYKGDSVSADNNYVFYNIDYKRLRPNGEFEGESFTLSPYAIFDKEKTAIQSVNPATKHYMSKDIFTHITAASDKTQPEYQVVYDTMMTYKVVKGDKIQLDSFIVIIEDIITEKAEGAETNYKLTMQLRVSDY